jgi:cell division protease FtsH
MNSILRNIILFLLILLTIGGILSTINLQIEKPQEIGVVEFVRMINAGEVKSVDVVGNKLNVEKIDGKKFVIFKEANETFGDVLKNYNADPEKVKAIVVNIKHEKGLYAWLIDLLPFLIPFLFVAGFVYFMMRQVQGANIKAMAFGQSRLREAKGTERITFKDVAGVKEAKEELKEVVDFLKHPKKFIKLGAKVPKGVLLMGPPGTGKTLLARAVAGEANVPFFYISGSEFVEMFVGVGAARVRDLFNKAKKNTPCILFIDEIDAVGRQRGAGLGGGHDEREQTLNQILVELDGFEPNSGLIVLAATNRPDILDPALLRPGRFDRRIVLDEPDIKDREEILKIHARGKPLEKNVSLRKIAERTPGFSGADLANLMNEAAILAARKNKNTIGEEELIESIEKVLLGPERRSFLLSPEERKITAYHEAGHALVAHETPHTEKVRKVSIVARGRAAGYTLKLPVEERRLKSKSEFLADIAVALGGYVAEKEVFGENTTGAANDLQVATQMARDLVTRYGMSDVLGPRTFCEKGELVFLGREITEEKNYSDKTAEIIDNEVMKIINNALRQAQNVIRNNRDKLEKIVQVLLEKETIEQEEFESLFI